MLHRACYSYMRRACPAELEGGGGGAGFCVSQPPPPPQPPSQPPPPLLPPLDHTLLKPPDGRLAGAKPQNGGGAGAGGGAAASGDTPSVVFTWRVSEAVGAFAERGASVAARENSHSPQHLRAKQSTAVYYCAGGGFGPGWVAAVQPLVRRSEPPSRHPPESEDRRSEPPRISAQSRGRPGKLREGKLWRTHAAGSRNTVGTLHGHAVVRYAARVERVAFFAQRAAAASAREAVLVEAVLGRGKERACICGRVQSTQLKAGAGPTSMGPRRRIDRVRRVQSCTPKPYTESQSKAQPMQAGIQRQDGASPFRRDTLEHCAAPCTDEAAAQPLAAHVVGPPLVLREWLLGAYVLLTPGQIVQSAAA